MSGKGKTCVCDKNQTDLIVSQGFASFLTSWSLLAALYACVSGLMELFSFDPPKLEFKVVTEVSAARCWPGCCWGITGQLWFRIESEWTCGSNPDAPWPEAMNDWSEQGVTPIMMLPPRTRFDRPRAFWACILRRNHVTDNNSRRNDATTYFVWYLMCIQLPLGGMKCCMTLPYWANWDRT